MKFKITWMAPLSKTVDATDIKAVEAYAQKQAHTSSMKLHSIERQLPLDLPPPPPPAKQVA